MTKTKIGVGGKKELRAKIISLAMLSITVIAGTVLSREAAEYVKEGMRLSVGCVIPSAFPFMIISDVYIAYGNPENIRLFSKLFSLLFGLPAEGIGAFVCGNVGGFPIGAKMCADACLAGHLGRDDAERLMPLCNNPSCAFVIGAVGIGMWADARIGFLLLISLYSSVLLCGILTRSKSAKININSDNIKQSYNLVESVKHAGMSSISIISFICLFSVVLGIIKKRVKYALLLYPIYALLEVTNAVNFAAFSQDLPEGIRLAICAFSLGFGGSCVGMQSAVFASSAGIKMGRYYRVKLLEGALAASIATLLYLI